MSVWDRLVGQHHVVSVLQDAVTASHEVLVGGSGPGMTHAWLLTGPPGSGRSTAARAFAAALECPDGGCGTCHACRTSLAGTHADVVNVVSEELSLGVDAVRGLVRDAAMSATGGRWRVIVIEDADRLTEQANNVLLKSLEEPPSRTVWLLCAPAYEDVLPTIRSRTRSLHLVTPTPAAIAAHLVSVDGVDEAMAAFAARASQGHIGRARWIARDERTRLRRSEVLRLPLQPADVGGCVIAAQNLLDAAEEDSSDEAAQRDQREVDELVAALGIESSRSMPAWARSQVTALKKRQEKRAKRHVRDSLDRALLDLTSFYRDVLVVQTGSSVDLVNAEMRADVARLAGASSPETSLRRIGAVMRTRERLGANALPLLALEEMTVALWCA